MILNVIEHCYYLPLVHDPASVFMQNHASATCHHEFVESAILELLKAGSVAEVARDEIRICSPLGVVLKKENELRLILDLRFLSKHLYLKKFKY